MKNRRNLLPRYSDGKLMKYSDVGLYPLFYIDNQGSVLCSCCADKSEEENKDFPEFLPVLCDVNYEDTSLYCDDCSTRIESAYADDEVTEEGNN